MSDYSDIQAELDDFKNAVYGEEVRDSMISAIKKIYDIAGDALESSGQPTTANTASEMEDTEKLYLYLGSESGYQYGYIYAYINGTWTSTGLYGKGEDGASGADGYSPTVTVTQTATGVSISVTDKNGTTSATVENGTATQEQVDSWLDEHPEATTTVQDGSITSAKLADGAVTENKIASTYTQSVIASVNSSLNHVVYDVADGNSGANPYITDGLILWLDGKNTGGNGDVWVDQISGVTFDLVNCSLSDDGVVFDGTSYGESTDAIQNGLTIEVAFQIDDNETGFALFTPIGSDTVGLFCLIDNSSYPATMMTRINNVSWRRLKYYPNQGVNLISACMDLSRTDNTVSEANLGPVLAYYSASNAYAANSAGKTYIGCRVITDENDKTLMFTGTIYSIRLYNRNLTRAEMLYNQRADIERFGFEI